MEKYVNKDGKVAVLFSPGYGSGWYTWNKQHPGLLYDVVVVQWVMSGQPSAELDDLETYLYEKYPGIYIGSNIDELRIAWTSPGTKFRIAEYEGSETVEFRDTSIEWQTA